MLEAAREQGKGSEFCAPGAHVTCPGSTRRCAGNQCCPPIPESGGHTFPCPSAFEVFHGCGNGTKVEDCIAPEPTFVPTPTPTPAPTPTPTPDPPHICSAPGHPCKNIAQCCDKGFCLSGVCVR